NYFELTNEKIISGIRMSIYGRSQKNKIIHMKPFFAVAASAALLIMLSLAVLFTNLRERKHIASNGFDSELLIENIIYHIDIMTLEEEVVSVWSEPALTDVKREDIIDYLVNDNMNLFEIYELL
ncbi:MAG: hypothetical protein ACUVTX_06425, partial [Bacteroidales bacterium]